MLLICLLDFGLVFILDLFMTSPQLQVEIKFSSLLPLSLFPLSCIITADSYKEKYSRPCDALLLSVSTIPCFEFILGKN